MKANAFPLLGIFEKKLRLEVPLFQRQYVWGQDQQWQPLWEDITRKFSEYLEGRRDTPVHFLGAMVLDQKQTPTTHVEKRQVIDGQQRLTTLQIFIATFRDFCRANEIDDLARECESFTINKGMMADPEVDKFKVWPTQLDRQQFVDVITAGSRDRLEKQHPQTKRRYARTYDPRPPMVEAYLFFYDQINEFFNGTSEELPLASEQPLAQRLEECFQALRSSLQVVVIDLEKDDDAQVIFETLNARGEPLLPADLLRNYIFLRAARNGENQELLYNEFWHQFDEPFWRQEARQGRLNRPRSDLFMQHFLASRLAKDIPVKHLFVEYKFWIEREKPFGNVRDEVSVLSRQGKNFRRIIDPTKDDLLNQLSTFLIDFDISTPYPLLLHLLDRNLTAHQWKEVTRTLESYFFRRAVCGMTTKNYNRVFLTLLRQLFNGDAGVENITKNLSELKGESTEWPSDQKFQIAWQSLDAYRTLQSHRLIHILKRIDATYGGSKTEQVSVDGLLTVEHILPQEWKANWPLPDGTWGMSEKELQESLPSDPRAQSTNQRDCLLQTIGNLTLLTQGLNSSVSNGPWKKKKPALLRASLLPINLQLHSIETWGELEITKRSTDMFNRAIKIWPAPPSK